jgi:hypothetical protein
MTEEHVPAPAPAAPVQKYSAPAPDYAPPERGNNSEYSAAARVMVFRHTQAVGLHPLDPGVVAWGPWMVHAAVANFAPSLGAVASTGDTDAALAAAQPIIDGLAD